MRWDNKTHCPCRDCQNARFNDLLTIECHLIRFGFSRSYQRWIFHGEEPKCLPNEQNGVSIDVEMADTIDDKVIDALNDACRPADQDINLEESPSHGNFENLFNKANKELYPGCRKFSALTFLVKLMHVKGLNYWSDKSFDMLLQLLIDTFPEGSNIPKTYYDAKKMLRELGLGYNSIYACKYDCALFWKENETLDKCPVCDEPRYKLCHGKGKKVPHKVLRHFPLKPRLQRLFMSRLTSIDMRWHKEKRINEDGVLRHPADSEACKDMDTQFPWFSQDPCNVRLGLSTDGFNPFVTMSISYSMWHVVLVPYNMPPWRCMKEMFFNLSLLIPGPQAPDKDIDVHLRPLIEELKELWHEGVQTFDVSTGENFCMHACILWTINDFPAYGNLSGWSTKGYKACPVCNEDTSSVGIRSKICYMGHRRFLPLDHSWRRSKQYDGKPEHRPPPKVFSSNDILQQLCALKEMKPGKHPNNVDRKRKQVPGELNWTKKSIFFELEYWPKLKLRHNIDVMHVERNVCDNIVGTLLNIEGKTKDTNKARLDLADMNIRKELHLQVRVTN